MVSLLFAPAILHSQEAGIARWTEETLREATDEQLVAVMSSTEAEETARALWERINWYSQEGRSDEIERLMPEFMAAADDNSVWEAKNVLLERARQYAEEERREEMERLMRLLVPVLENTSLDELRRLHALEVLRVPARFESTSDEAFVVVCRLIVDDPSAKVRYRAVHMLQEPSRSDAIPFFKAAALDERNVARGGPRGSVRQAAIETLGWCGAPDAAAVLLELRFNESLSREDQDVTITALGRTGSADVALPELLKIVETGDSAEMCSAILGLGAGFYRYPPDARSTIMDVLRAGLHHANDSRRRATCTAMKYTGDFYLIPLIEPLLDDPLVRPRAESAIKELQRSMAEYRQMVGIPDEERDMPIEQVVQKGWAYSAIMLRWRLADDPTRQEIFDKLAKAAVTPPDETARRHVLRVFEQLPERRDDTVPVVLQMLTTTQDPLMRDDCYRVLGKLGGPEAIQILKKVILKDRPKERTPSLEWELYGNRFLYLGSCGPDAAPVLFEIAKKLDRENDYSLWAGLAATNNEELVMPFLLEKARTTVEWKHSRALHSACLLAYKSSPDTRRQIAEMLVQDADSEHSSVREVVAWGLGMVGDETHIALLERIATEDPYSSRQVGSRGEEKIDRIVYPIREAAAKSIENIRTRVAQEQEAAAE
jgi:HEAT repeat protein